MNQHIIIGNLTRDPESGTTQGGARWCTFSVAVNGKRNQDGSQETEYMRVTAWSALADSCARYLRKGRKVCVIGDSRAHGWTGQGGDARAQIEITARQVEFLSAAADGGAGAPSDEDARRAGAEHAEQVRYTEVQPDDLPY